MRTRLNRDLNATDHAQSHAQKVTQLEILLNLHKPRTRNSTLEEVHSSHVQRQKIGRTNREIDTRVKECTQVNISSCKTLKNQFGKLI